MIENSSSSDLNIYDVTRVELAIKMITQYQVDTESANDKYMIS